MQVSQPQWFVVQANRNLLFSTSSHLRKKSLQESVGLVTHFVCLVLSNTVPQFSSPGLDRGSRLAQRFCSTTPLHQHLESRHELVTPRRYSLVLTSPRPQRQTTWVGSKTTLNSCAESTALPRLLISLQRHCPSSKKASAQPSTPQGIGSLI